MKRIIDICFDYNYKELVEHGYREKGILDFHVVDCPIHFEYGLLKPFTKEHMIENLKKILLQPMTTYERYHCWMEM